MRTIINQNHISFILNVLFFQADLVKALENFQKYRQRSEHFDRLKADASLQLTRLYLKLAERRSDQESLEFVIKAYQASTESQFNRIDQFLLFHFLFALGSDKKIENETCFKLGQTFIEHGDVDSALIYLEKYYEYCRQVNDDEGFGRASETLAICYQK